MKEQPIIAPAEAATLDTEAAAWVVHMAAAVPPPAVCAAFAAWLAADPAHAAAYQRAKALWISPALAAALCSPPAANAAKLFPAASPCRPLRRPRIAGAPLRWAAAFALLLAAGQAAGLPTMVGDGLRLASADHATRTGEQRAVALTTARATLDGASALDSRLTAGGEHVTLLRGAAYFEVPPAAPGQAFMVEAGPALVRVIGTAFAVHHLADGAAEVAVRQGVVTVSSQAAATVPLATLHAGDRLRIEPDGTARPLAPAADAFAWLGGRLQFHDRPLGEVVAALDRWFPGMIVIASPALAAVPVSGSYRLDDPAAVAASLAAAVSGRLYRLGGSLLIIS